MRAAALNRAARTTSEIMPTLIAVQYDSMSDQWSRAWLPLAAIVNLLYRVRYIHMQCGAPDHYGHAQGGESPAGATVLCMYHII